MGLMVLDQGPIRTCCRIRFAPSRYPAGEPSTADFFCDEDYQTYQSLMVERCGAHNVEIWAYCLMPNHIHLIAVP
jgi:Transposase IS200 like